MRKHMRLWGVVWVVVFVLWGPWGGLTRVAVTDGTRAHRTREAMCAVIWGTVLSVLITNTAWAASLDHRLPRHQRSACC
jgi:hypothetical protein